MADYYKLVSSTNPHTDWVTEIVLERDKEGNATKSVSAAGGELSADDRKKVEDLGYTVEKVTKSEVQEAQASQVGSDVAGSGPIFGDSEAPDQSVGYPSAKNDK